MSNAQVWIVTAWEDEHQHRRLFAKGEDALACASRWKDDLLDEIQIRLADLWEADVPF